ncbi:hypothetical protein [uncultured Pontibacter sp.]|uniref:hypothetical protein n=1 Tax=uncultured Pontibacter sp. TaxID=453356 RepID=UPI0026073FC4|nr:hypothetical protein [uncultured Pontibacter sp.]
MELKEVIKAPNYNSQSDYSTGKDGNSDFLTFNCHNCGNALRIDFQKQIDYSWKGKTDRISEIEQQNLKQYYSIGLSQKSHDGGLPVFDKIICSKCSATYMTYCGVVEFSNSAYNVIVQGIIKI